MLLLYEKYNYIADPHGAIGYLGIKKFKQRYPDTLGIFLETAHPVKFLDVVEPVLNETIEYPQQILDVIDKEKISTKISTYNELKSYLISTK